MISSLNGIWKFGIGAVLAIFGAVSLPAMAQVESTALEDPDLWTVSFLRAGEVALPPQSWAASDSRALLSLTKTTRTRNLSPAEQLLLRRLVLSAADGPDSEQSDDLLAERARLMFQIGEASAAAQLLPTLKIAPEGLETEEVAVDLQLAIGQSEAACLSGVGEGKAEAFWIKLRAVCFALEDNFEQAELAMELAAAQGVNDPWLTRAIFAASGAVSGKPEARFDTGLSLAMSVKASLEPSVRTIANSRLDLAAAIARQETFTPAMRVQAAGVAAEAGLLDAASHRALYKALVESEGFAPRTALEVALKTVLTEGNDTGAKARAVRAALRTARGNVARYAAVSRLLLEDIKALPAGADYVRMAPEFAGAALAAADFDTAAAWANLEGQSDAFQAIWLTGLIHMARAAPDQAEGAQISADLVKVARGTKQTFAAARLFMLSSALEGELPYEARAMLAQTRGKAGAAQRSASPYLLESLQASANADAGAELVLQTLKLVGGDASRLAAAEAAGLVRALGAIGQGDAARVLALEASGYWRAAL